MEEILETPATTPETPPVEPIVPGTQDAATTPELTGWLADERYSNEWAEDPNKLYDSHRTLETNHADLNTKYETANADLDSHKTQLSQYTQLQEILNLIEGNEKYSGILEGALKDIDKQEMISRYGQELPEPIRKMANEYEQMKSKETSDAAEAQAKTARDEQKGVIDKQYDLMEATAKEYGIKIDYDAFIDHVSKNDIPTNMMNAAFTQFSMPQIKAVIQEQTQTTVLANRDKVNTVTVPGGKAQSVTPPTGKRTKADVLSKVSSIMNRTD